MIKTIFFYILFFISFFINSIKACEIVSFDRIIRSSEIAPNFKDIAKSTNCSAKIKMTFLKAIKSSKGVINSRIFKEDLKVLATVKPNRIRIEILEENLLKHFNLNDNWAFKKTHSINKSSTITLTKNEMLDYECQNCTSPGAKNINIVIRDAIKGSQKTMWLKSKLLTRSYALISNGDFNVDNKPLDKNSFYLKEVYSETPELYFRKKDILKFYKLNKVLRKDKPILFSNISPMPLVKNGTAVSVTLLNDSLSLQGKAVPMKNGNYGETIQLRNVQSNRIIIGKVVDFNKVVVEL
jgi:flagella basal body P-ring formation protein FlgA